MPSAPLIFGLFALWAAAGSPLAVMDHCLLTFHMLQHLILMTVAAPLLLLGAPRVILQRLPAPSLVLCWLASTVTVIAWHVPALFEIGMQSNGWHGFEQATFLVAGLLFWWPVARKAAGSRWSVPLYLFLATLPCDALSAFLTFCDRVVYPHYLTAPRMFDISPLRDQECAGALMWVWVTFAYLAPAVVVTMRMLSPQRATSLTEVA